MTKAVIAMIISFMVIGRLGAVETRDTTSLYRENQPNTMSSSIARGQGASGNEQAAIGEFGQVYQAAGRPKVIILWNRVLSGNPRSSDQPPIPSKGSGVLAEDNYSITANVHWKVLPPRTFSMEPPSGAMQFALALNQTLRDAGMRIVDQNTVIRREAWRSAERAPSGGGATRDYRIIGMSAIGRYAKYYLTITFIQDDNTTSYGRPRIRFINSRTGEILANWPKADLLSESSKDKQWVADAEGFHEEKGGSGSAREGRTTAIEVIRGVAGALSR